MMATKTFLVGLLCLVMFADIHISVNAIECTSCEYLRVTASPGLIGLFDPFSSYNIGSESCYLDESLKETCSFGGSCYSVLSTTVMDYSVLTFKLSATIHYARRGCSQANTINECAWEVDSNVPSAIRQLIDTVNGTLETETVGGTPDVHCCLYNYCNSNSKPGDTNQGSASQQSDTSASVNLLAGYVILVVNALMCFVI